MGKIKLETAVNVAILLVCVMVGFTFISNYRSRPTRPEAQKPGDKLNIPAYDFAKHPTTMIAVVREGCRYCADQMPFYKALVNQGANLILAMPTDLEKGKAYAAKNGLAVEVIPNAQEVLKIRGTPTLLLVRSTGEIQKVWEGQIPLDKQDEVFQAINVTKG